MDELFVIAIKQVLIFMLLTFFLIIDSYGQEEQNADSSSTNSRTSAIIKYVAKNELDSIFKVQLDSALNADKKISLGRIFLKAKDNNVKIYPGYGVNTVRDDNDTKEKKLESNEHSVKKIDRVEIYIKNFAIQSIAVYTEDGEDKFINRVPIPLAYFDRRVNDRLGSRDSDTHVKLGDVIDFVPKLDNIYAQNEIILPALTSKNQSQEIKVDGKLNSLINARIFSDFTSLLENEPNGTIQFEADATYPLNLKNSFGSPTYWLHYIQPRVSISRFSEAFLYLNADSIRVKEINDMNDTTEVLKNTLDVMNAYQQSWLRAGISLNVFHYTPLTNHLEFMIDITGKYNQGKVMKFDGIEETMIMFDFGSKASLLTRPMKHFGLLMSVEIDYMVFSGINDFEIEKRRVGRINTSMEAFFENDKENRIFLRWSYYDDVSNKLQDFSQFQFGYSTTLKVNK